MSEGRVKLHMKTLAGAIAGCALVASTSVSAAYPEKPIRILVGSAAGGGIDLLARNLARVMNIGQPVVVEDRPGAAGLIAAEAVVKAPPDGYTILMGTGAITALPHHQEVSFDPRTDFSPVTQFGSSAVYFVVNAEYAAKNSLNTLADLMALAKQNPGKLNYGTTGPSSTTSMTMAQFAGRTGLNFFAVTYKGTVPVATALLAQEIQLMIGTPEQIQAQLTAGKLKALAVTSSRRLAIMPEVPTVAEAARLPGFTSTVWYGFLAPPKTPQDIVARLHKEGVAAIRSPTLKAPLDNIGFEIVGSSPQEFSEFLRQDYANQAVIVKMMKAMEKK